MAPLSSRESGQQPSWQTNFPHSPRLGRSPLSSPPPSRRSSSSGSCGGGGSATSPLALRIAEVLSGQVRSGNILYVGGADGACMTTVLLQTTMGDVKIELLDETMPITAGNFRKLVGQGFYDGTIFHRVIPNFMIQGGDPDGTGMGGPGYSIKDELPPNNRNGRGTISMANAGPNTG